MSLRVLVSALSCNAAIGSEALVGYKTVEALTKRHAVTLVSAKPCIPPEGVEVHELDIGSCSFNDVPTSAVLRFELLQRSLVKRLHGNQPFDLVHRVTPSHYGIPSLLPNLKIPLIRGPVIAADPPPASFEPMMRRPVSSSQDSRWHPRRIRRALLGRLMNEWTQRSVHLKCADRILVGNTTAMHHIPESLHGSCRGISYSGVEHEIFTPPLTRTASGPLRLLWVGRMIPYKGVELLLRSVALAAKKVDLRLRIVGAEDPVYGCWCRSLAAELGLRDRVSFEPPLPRMELVSLYQQTDVFCFTTLCDTYGIALLEAMSCGCAVIVSDVAGAGEIVNGTNGIKIPLTNPDTYTQTFANAVERLADQSAIRLEMGEAARRHILLHHDWSAISLRLYDIYEEIERDFQTRA